MKRILLATYLVFVGMGICYSQNWTVIKDTASPKIELPSEYDSIYRQPLSGLGWEDGVHISDDGLHLYCTYIPIDLLSFSLNGDLPNNYSTNYLRGAPDFGMDLITNPLSSSEWLHSDILYSTRGTLTDSFTTWQLTNMARPFYSEGAPTPNYSSGSPKIDMMLFTSNDNMTNNMDIWFITNTGSNPSGTGTAMPLPITTSFNEDNPHLVDLQNDTLVLFFDSDNLPNGNGDIDIWYALSYDDGQSWNSPVNVSSINTASKEHQPFVFHDQEKDKYFLYYSSFHTDNKLAIFRRAQQVENDWNSWGNAELVISAGNCAGIGEPTLTESGDISFVVVYEDLELNSIYDRFDSDPWYLRKKEPTLGLDNRPTYKNDVVIYPNPSAGILNIETHYSIESVKVFNSRGETVLQTANDRIVLNGLSLGIYYVHIATKSGIFVEKLSINK